MPHYAYDLFERAHYYPVSRDRVSQQTIRVLDVTGDILTLAEAKAELCVFDTGNATLDAETDTRVSGKIAVVRQWCEDIVYRTFASTSNRVLTVDCWPDGEVRFHDPPLIGITAIKYRDADDVEQTVDPTEYDVMVPTKGPGRLKFRNTFAKPELFSRADAVTIEYQTGYGDVANIPAAAKQAALLMLSFFWDDDREDKVLATYERSAISLLRGLDWGGYA